MDEDELGEGESDWTISWTKERGCGPSPSKGGKTAERVLISALEGVAILQSACTISMERRGECTANAFEGTMDYLKCRSVGMFFSETDFEWTGEGC